MLTTMRYLALISFLLIAGCQSSDMSLVPVDPMAELCITTDFSRHTDKELRQCGAWLAPRAARYQALPQRRYRDDSEPTTYSIYSNGGKLQSLLSCSGTTCTEVPH